MAWLGTDALPITAGWGSPPQLHAAPIGDLVGSILKDRLLREESTKKTIADTIKQFQQQRESQAYTEALQKAGLLPEGDYGGIGLKGGESLADLLRRQKADQALAAHRTAMEARIGGGRGRGRGGSSGGGAGDVEAEVPEDYYGLSVAPGKPSAQTRRINPATGMVEIQKARGRWEVGPKWMQEQRSGTAQSKTGGENPYSDRYKMMTTPDVVTYWSPDYSKKLTAQEAEADSNALAVLPDKTSMPYTDYKDLAGKVVNKYYTNKAGTPSAAQPEVGGGADKNLAPDYGQVVSDADVEALSWARSHPDDPRSAAILKKLGL